MHLWVYFNMNIQEWQACGTKVSHKNNDIFLIRQGSGSPLLLLHGFPTSSWDWVKIWPDLIKKFEVIAFDFIGFGYSDKPKDYSYTLMDQADLAQSIITAIGHSNIQLLAHDYGDTVAQELLARQNEGSLPFKIDTTTLLNGGLFPGVHKPRLIQKLLMTPLGPILGKLYTKKALTRTFNEIFGPMTPPSEQEIDALWELMNHNNGKAVVHKLIRYMAERVTHENRWLKALQESKCPIRLINGAADPISGIHLVNHYRKVVPNPDCVVLEGIGHYPQVESPEEVMASFLEFTKPA